MSARSWPELAAETERQLRSIREQLEDVLIAVDVLRAHEPHVQRVVRLIDQVEALRQTLEAAIARPAEQHE